METPAHLVPTANVIPPRPSFIHKYYILLKAHYFLFFSAFGILCPILNLTLRSRGLSNIELSYINIFIPFLVFLTNPLLGYIADRSRRYLLTFSVVLVVSTILCTIMFVLPPIRTHHIQANVIQGSDSSRVLNFCASQEVATKCASRSICGCSYRADCTSGNSKFNFTLSIKKEIEGIRNVNEPAICGIQYQVPIEPDIQQKYKFNDLTTCGITCSIAHFCHGPRYPNQRSFLVLYSFLFILGSNLIFNAVPLGASIGFATVSNPEIFGAQRVYGTVGFGIAAFAASRVYEFYGTDLVYIIMFSITTIACVIVTSFIRIRSNKKLEDTIEERELDDLPKEKQSQSRLSTLLPLLQKIDVIIFLSLTLVWGMSYAGLDPYLFLYVDEIAGCQSRAIVGWMSLMSAIAEIAGFFLASRVLKILGANLSAIIILLAFSARFTGYYLITQPYFLIAMETMHFFNFGILYVLIVQKADSIAPPGLSGTLQGVALGMSFGLGRGVGLLIASFIYTMIESRLLFLIIALFNLIAAVIYSIYFLFTHCQQSKNDQNRIEDDGKSKFAPLLVVPTKNQIDEQ